MKKRRRICAAALSVILILTAAACSSGTVPAPSMSLAAASSPLPVQPAAARYEIALITDAGNVDDNSYNQDLWEAVSSYAQANAISYAYYRPSENSAAARTAAIKAAVSNGAQTVVCRGTVFEPALYELQTVCPDVNFLLLDGEPHAPDYAAYETASNTHCIVFREEQAGYLAGYAAVMDGYTKLGFLGGADVPTVIRYGCGFVQGADAAARERGMAAGGVELKYWYSGVFADSADVRTRMDLWYAEGTQVVFACGGGIYLSAVAAAESAGGKVICSDADRSAQSDCILTSAVKSVCASTELALASLYANGGIWDAGHAGQTAVLGAAEEGIGLATAEGAWRLEHFTVSEYNALYVLLKNGALAVDRGFCADIPPSAAVVSVDYQG